MQWLPEPMTKSGRKMYKFEVDAFIGFKYRY